MKFSTVAVGLLAMLTPLTAAWTSEDREIFRIRDELAVYEGANITFYDYLGITPSATQDDINKAYRKKAKLLHPDKVRQKLQSEHLKASKASAKKSKKGSNVVKSPTKTQIKSAIKKAEQQAQRLTIVADVLRGPGRDRYDHFLKNGFPVWKGTEYYYSRYRPGFGTVIFGVFIVAGGAVHYLAMYLGWKRQRDFVERYIKIARQSAWGDDMGIPGISGISGSRKQPQIYDDSEGNSMPVNRRLRRMRNREYRKEAATSSKRPAKGLRAGRQESPEHQQSGPQGAKRRVVAENGKILVVDSLGNVYLEEEDEHGNVQEFYLDPDELHRPTIGDTAVFRLPAFVLRQTLGRLVGGRKSVPVTVTDSQSREKMPSAPAASPKLSPSSSDAHQPTSSSGPLSDDSELPESSLDELDQAGSTAMPVRRKAYKRKIKRKF